MASISKMTIIGHLGSDPEIKHSQNGTAVCNLRIAVTDRRKETDTFVDHTEWFTLICFGKTAENAHRFLKKGKQIFAEGRFQARKWTDKDGVVRINLEIICEKMVFLGSQKEEPSSSWGDDDANEDIPF